MLSIIKYTLTFIYQLIPFSLIKKDNKVCFSSVPNYSDSSIAVARCLIKLGLNHEIVWLEVGSKEKDIPIDIAPYVKKVKKNSLAGIWHFITSSLAFHTHGIYSFARVVGPFQVGLWHGMPIKNIGFRDGKNKNEVVYSDVVISTSKYFSLIMAESFGLPLDRVWLTGLPRNDVLANNNQADRDELINILKIDTNTKIVAWLPTYRKSFFGDIRSDSQKHSFLDDWDAGFLKRLDDYCSKKHITIFIKIHPMDYLNHHLPSEYFKSIILMTSEQWDAYGFELYRALSCSDCLISDISSVIVDYFVSGKPVGITEISINDYDRGVISEISNLLSCCYVINDELSLYKFISGQIQINHCDNKANEEIFYDVTLKDSLAASRVLRRALTTQNK